MRWVWQSWMRWLAMLLLLGGATGAHAAACTSAATGNWSAAATWAAPCNVAGGPVAADTVTIATAHTVTVDVTSAAASIAVAAPSGATNGVTLAAGITLNVGGAITMAAPGTNLRTSTFAVGSGALTAASIAISGGTGTKVSQMTVSTGTITTTGNITFAGTAANARFVSTGASTVNVGGNFGSGGTLTTAGTGTINFNGGAAQTIGAYATYNNIAINNTAGGVALAGNATIGGMLSVNTGTLTVGAFTLAVTGATTVNSAISITSTTGTKTFTGNVTINSGGTLSETVAELITYGGDVTINNGGTLTEFGAATMACAGNLQNDGTYTASTGVHTFSGAAKTFGGANPVVIPSVTVSGTYQNNGTLTVATALAGAGTLTNGATGTLNIGDASITPTLTATAAGNTVNYTLAGTQTVKATAYHHLGLGGTSAKTMAGVTVIGGDLNVSGSATMTNNAAFTVAGALNYTSTGTTTLAAATPISIGSFNQTAGTLAAGANTITVTGSGAGAWTRPAGTFTTTGTVIFTGAAPQIGASNFGNLTINTGAGTATLAGNAVVAGNLAVSTGTLDLAAFTADRSVAGGTLTVADGATLKIGGTNGFPANYATHTLGAASAVEYSGASQNVAAEAAPGYGNLTVSGSGTKTAAGSFTVRGILTLNGAFAVGANTLTLNGPAIAGTPANLSTTAASSLSFGGTASGVNLPGSVLSLNNLTVNNGNGVTLNSSPALSGVLTLTSGAVSTGAYILSASANCPASVARSGGFISGNLRLTFPTGTTTCTYHVGSGGNYAPIVVTMTASAGGTLTGSTTGNEHPQIASSAIDPNKDVNRYWSLWMPGDTVVATGYDATFNFVAGDVDIAATASSFVVGKYTGGAWSLPVPVTAAATSTGVTGIAGPLAAVTDFAAGEAAFVCSVPAGSPVGTTCVCDNFNRATLNPSTIYGGNWNVSSSSGAFGLPRIVANKLRLTDNSTMVSTAATAPGTFPAAGNWIAVEFKLFAYSGTGADGMAFTLSDSTIPAVPGAFGGSLGYAQKCQNGVAGCVSDCNVAGGCPGFTGGWIGLGLDEYGNYSNGIEGRSGGPGLTLDSVAVRGSGAGQSGYPYLAGSLTLNPGIDNAASATPAYGHAYRLTVDARNYTWDGAAGAKTAMVSLERDTTGTGNSYAPLVPPFDAYTANPSQANVPANWQISFTGSTGASVNIHEITDLKICAQTYVPPAGYRIQVDNLTPTTCPSDPQPTVTVSALNANNQVITTYTGTVNLSAMLLGGGASSATWSTYPGNLGAWDGVNNRYTFAAGDNGVAKFYLSDLVQQDVYITISEHLGTLSSTLGSAVQFSSGVASFAVGIPDALGSGVVAGRPHLMRITRNQVACGGGTDTTFAGARLLDGWYDPAAGDHPAGALAPQICAPVSGACIPSYGSCQTLSIAPPVVDSASNNLSLTFVSGVADFCLVTSDVGKYSLGLRDDVTVPASPVTGSSTILTARPFAVVVSDVRQGATNNPANGTSGGSVFAKAGTAFQATVAGYLWNGAGDTGSNGLPGAAADWSAITGAGIAPSYADTVTLAASAPFAPAAGVLSGVVVAVASGSTTSNTLGYNEVGSFTLTATPATAYLNTAGVDLGNRVAIFSNPASPARSGQVGRFIPDHFDTAVVLSGGVPMPCPIGLSCPDSNDVQDGFVYSGQPFRVRVTAMNMAGVATANYDGALGYSKAVTLSAWDALGSTAAQNPSGALANVAVTDASFGAGIATTAAPTYTLAAMTTAPTDIFLRALDTDGVISLRATPSNSIEGGVKVTNGRIKISNAHGSELLALPLAVTVQYWNGADWLTSSTDTTALVIGNVAIANCQKNLGNPAPACKPVVAVGAVTLAGGVGSIRLAAPGAGNNGSADLILNAAGWPAWLPSNTARATFGVYKGNNEFIYLRENY